MLLQADDNKTKAEYASHVITCILRGVALKSDTANMLLCRALMLVETCGEGSTSALGAVLMEQAERLPGGVWLPVMPSLARCIRRGHAFAATVLKRVSKAYPQSVASHVLSLKASLNADTLNGSDNNALDAASSAIDLCNGVIDLIPLVHKREVLVVRAIYYSTVRAVHAWGGRFIPT